MTPEQAELDFDAAANAAEDGESLVVDLDGFEGPLHVLLALARTQKVDLLKLSVTRLCDQYLAFIHEARRRRFALAADYLVMAAWLTYLKSRLLLPKPERKTDDGLPPEDLAAVLAFRLAKLDAIRRALDALKARPQTGRDVFLRGAPEETVVVSEGEVRAELFDLVQAYIGQRQRNSVKRYQPRIPQAYALEDARVRLKSMVPELKAWTPLAGLAPLPSGAEEPSRASYLASTLSAGLELVKEGELEARQLEAFADIYLRLRAAA